jgi:hypothetical protein
MGAQNCSIAGDEVKPNWGVLEEVFEVAWLMVKSRRFVKAVDGADNGAVFSFNWLDMDDRPDAGTIRALDPAFDPPDRNAGAKHRRHRGFVARNLSTIEI